MDKSAEKYVGEDTQKQGEQTKKESKVKVALGKAAETWISKENEGKHWWEKIYIFAKTFWQEWHMVDQEEEKVTDESKEAIKKGVEETLKDAKEVVGLDESKVDEDGKKNYYQFLAFGVAGLKESGANNEAAARDALKICRETLDGDKDKKLSFKQIRSLGGVGLLTLVKLKEEYPDKDKFKEVLVKFSKVSDHSKYPLSKLVGRNIKELFKLDWGKKAELAGKIDSTLFPKLIEAYGIVSGDEIIDEEKLTKLAFSLDNSELKKLSDILLEK